MPLGLGLLRRRSWRSSSTQRRKIQFPKRFPSLSPESRGHCCLRRRPGHCHWRRGAIAQEGHGRRRAGAAPDDRAIQIENPTIDLDRREELALEMAATLDRAAQRANDAVVRRQRWSEAIELLDWFLKENPDPPRERQLRFQAAVYRWAQARSWIESGHARPARSKTRRERSADARRRDRAFRAVAGGGNNPTLADNLRFRLAEALADRADLEPAGRRPAAVSRESEALESARPTARRKRASPVTGTCSRPTCFAEAGKPAEAEKEIDAAAQVDAPSAAARDRRGQRPVPGRTRTISATRSSRSSRSHLDRPAQGTLDGPGSAGSTGGTLPAGTERFTRRVRTVSAGSTSCGAGRRPSAGRRSSTWPERRSSPTRASRRKSGMRWRTLMGRRVTRPRPAPRWCAPPIGRPRWGRRPWRPAIGCGAAAFFFRPASYTWKPTRSYRRSPTTRPPAPFAPRPACSAAWRAAAPWPWACPGVSECVIREGARAAAPRFSDATPRPTKPAGCSAGSAVAAGDRPRAEALWSAMASQSPRWLDSRLAIAALDRDLARPPADQSRPPPDDRTASSGPIASWTTRFAGRSPRRPRPSCCWPGPGSTSRPAWASPRSHGNSANASAGSPVLPASQYRARLYRLVALVELGRYVEAEREAQVHPSWRVHRAKMRPCSTRSACSTSAPPPPRATCVSGGLALFSG